jgi:6,7-dimethyl-8-ribityllumazine synthase
MSTDDKKHFDALVGKILQRVVDACPAQSELSAQAFGIDTDKLDAADIAKSFEIAQSKKRLLRDTVQWLVAEGFIRAGSSADHYVATLQSLKLYNAQPNVLKK